MIKGLMHNLIGGHTIANANAQMNAALQNSVLKAGVIRNPNTKRIFQGNIEVNQVANGYTVNIGSKDGYEYTTHIAHTIVEVNEIIAAAMVAFQLENK